MFRGGIRLHCNRQIVKSGRRYALDRLRSARSQELGQALGWEASSNMRKERATGAGFRLLWVSCKRGGDPRNLRGTGESCLLAMPCNKTIFGRREKNLFTEQVPS